jgi:hypothetical protein
MVFFALVLIIVGVLALLDVLGIIQIEGSLWDYVWPIVLIAFGLSLLWGRHRVMTWRRRWWHEPDDVTKQ